MDKRKKYYLTLDTETAGTVSYPIIYNIGGAVHDKDGKVYDSFSFVVEEIFYGKPELMNNCYFVTKIPDYIHGIDKGEYKVVTYRQAEEYICALCEMYNIDTMIAHNADFDYRALRNTAEVVYGIRDYEFLPEGMRVWDTLAMARSVIVPQKGYQKWCANHDYLTKHGKPRATAEILHRYLSGDNEFVEEHTALADVLIEITIFAHCVRQHKKMKRSPWRE